MNGVREDTEKKKGGAKVANKLVESRNYRERKVRREESSLQDGGEGQVSQRSKKQTREER